MPLIPPLFTQGRGAAGGGISAADQAKLDNAPNDTNAELALKAAKATTISTTAPLSGGGDLSTNRTLTIAEATQSVKGAMSAADKIKIDSFQAFGYVIVAHLNSGNMQSTMTDMSSTILRSPTGTWKSTDLRGVTQLVLEINQTAAAASTARLALIFSTGQGPSFTWYYANGTVGGATDGTQVPVDGSTAPTEPDATTNYQAAVLATSTPSIIRKVVNVPTSFQVEYVNIGWVRWGGDGVADPSFADIRVLAKGSTFPGVGTWNGRDGDVVPVSGDYTADTIPEVAADYSLNKRVWMRDGERSSLSFVGRLGKSPFNYVRKLTGLDLTRDFGANNLSADAVPDGTSGTNDRTKLRNIREYLRDNYAGQEFELCLPRGRCVAISQSVNWDLQNEITHFVGGGMRDSVFVGTSTTETSFKNGPFNFGGTTNQTLAVQEVWRLAEGVSGNNILAYDDAFIAPNSGDYNAVQVGDWLMFLSAWYYNNGTGNPPWAPGRRWTARVVSKGASGRINLDRRFPFPLWETTDGSLNGGAYIYKDSGGTPITGNVFARFSDMTPESSILSSDPATVNGGADGGSSGDMFHARVNMYNLGIAVRGGFPIQGGLPLDSVWEWVEVNSDNYAIYGNAMQGCYMRNIYTCNTSGFIELGVCSANNVFEDFVWSYRSVPILNDSSAGWILRTGERSFDNVFRRGQLLGRGKTGAVDPGSGPTILQGYVSSGMVCQQIYVELGLTQTGTGFSNGWYGFYATANGTAENASCVNNVCEDVYFNMVNASSPGGCTLNLLGNGCAMRRVKTTGSAASYSPPQIGQGADYCSIEDVVVKGNPNAVVGSGSNRCIVRRYNGNVTNNGTNTVLDNNAVGAAQLGNFFKGL